MIRHYFNRTRYVDEVHILMLWNYDNDTPKTSLWLMTHIYCLCVNIYICLLYKKRKNNARRFDTEGFVQVYSLCGVVVSLYWFTKCFIGSTENIWSVVYMNEKCKNIFRNPCVHHNWMYDSSKCSTNNSTLSLNSWWSCAPNACNTPRTEKLS